MFFENKYFVNEKMLKEYVNKVLCRNVFVFGIIVIFFAIFESIFYYKSENFQMLTINIITIFICLFAILYIPKLTFSNLIELDKKLHSGERPEAIVTFEDKIKLVEGNQVLKIDYSQINSYIRMKNSSVLMFSKQNGILFVEDNFTVGTKENFESFILEKCPHIKKVAVRN